jgi:hypothetical protein
MENKETYDWPYILNIEVNDHIEVKTII